VPDFKPKDSRQVETKTGKPQRDYKNNRAQNKESQMLEGMRTSKGRTNSIRQFTQNLI